MLLERFIEATTLRQDNKVYDMVALDLLCGSFWLQSINLRVFCLVLRKKIAPKDYYPNLRADRTDQRSKEDVRGSKTYGEKRFNDFNRDEDLYKEKKLKEHNEF